MINSYAGLDDAGVAIAAARGGANVVCNMYGQRLARIDKGAGDFATAADVEAEKTILGVIRSARPDDAVLGAWVSNSNRWCHDVSACQDVGTR